MRYACAAATVVALLSGGCGDRDGGPTAAAVVPLADEVVLPDLRPGDFWEYEVRSGDPPARWSLEVGEVLGNGRYRARTVAPDSAGGGVRAQEATYAGPWNVVQPVPAQSLTYLEFPLRQGRRWTSMAVGPGDMIRTLQQEVQGAQMLTLAGARVNCVRVQGTETTGSGSAAGVAVPVRMTIWYCPELRAVGRVESLVPLAPAVTHTLVARRRLS